MEQRYNFDNNNKSTLKITAYSIALIVGMALIADYVVKWFYL